MNETIFNIWGSYLSEFQIMTINCICYIMFKANPVKPVLRAHILGQRKVVF